MHVLVTGGAGFIGSHVTELLLDRGHQVTVVDDFSGAGRHHLFEQAALHRISVLDPALEQICAGVDAVVHAAAQTSVAASVADPVNDALTNIMGTIETVWAAAHARVRRFVYLSSAAVYKAEGDPPFSEGHPIGPCAPYGLSKWAGEEYVRLLGDLFGFEYVVLRLANVYGPRQSALGEAGVIARWVSAAAAGEPVTLQGDGGQTRDFVYVKDVAEAVVMALHTSLDRGLTLNVGTGQGTAIRDLVPLLEAVSGRKIPVIQAPLRTGDIRHSALDSRTAHQILGWQPRIPLEKGLAQTMAEAE